ncbi:MAG: DUF86 domain-containing protein [Deltaproteobacteria bacterium]|nr:DUF86 domain-containing protein [Deltaproteobacteria bacterium]
MTHLVELVGEAAGQIPRATQKRYRDIPWPKIVSMRNRLIHGYDFVDYDILWDTITQDLPLSSTRWNKSSLQKRADAYARHHRQP